MPWAPAFAGTTLELYAAGNLEAIEKVSKEPSPADAGGGKSRPDPAQERKQRLAEALRRNLVKRKDKKSTNPGGKSAPR